MNIAFMIDKLSVGGTQRQLILLANKLAEIQAGNIMVICLQRQGPLADELSEKIDVVSLGLDRVYGVKAIVQMLRLRAILQERQCQLLHAFLPSANIFGALLGIICTIPTVVSRRDVGIYPNKYWQCLEEKVAFRLATSIVCVSREVKDLLLLKEQTLSEKTILVPNAVERVRADGDTVTQSYSVIDEPYIVTVGRITPVKGFDLLLDVASGINGKVVVIGAGDDLEKLKRSTKDKGLQDKIEFLGHKNPHQIAAIVSRASFAVHPSYSEGMSNAILEYMVYGNAVVCRDLAANRELISHGKTGFLFRENLDFVEYVNTLIGDPQLRADMAEKARLFVKENHSVESILARYSELYQKLVTA